MVKKRRLTKFPKDSIDYFSDPETGDVEVDWKAENTRIAAFVAVRTLLGGVDKVADFGLMMRLFPGMRLSGLRKFWIAIRKARRHHIDQLTERFRQQFLTAYEKGEIAAPDYSNVLGYDWKKVVAWTLKLAPQAALELPETREALEDQFAYAPEPETHGWRDSYFQPGRSVWNRFEDITAEAAVVSLEPGPETMNDATRARSWIRALSCTPVARYAPASIKQKLLAFGGAQAEINEILGAAVRQLQNQRVLRPNRKPTLGHGRAYQLMDHFQNQLDRNSQAEKFRLAGEFKALLDQRFRAGEALELPYAANDGAILALINLQAEGRVKAEGIDLPDVPFGFEPGNYESRKYPKRYHHFAQRVLPTDQYVYSDDLRVGAADIPGEGPSGELPIWCDFFGLPHEGRWTKVLGAMMFVFATRGTVNVEQTVSALKPTVEMFEVDMIIEWGIRSGIIRESISGEGLVLAEWWWLIVAQQFERAARRAAVEDGAGQSKG